MAISVKTSYKPVASKATSSSKSTVSSNKATGSSKPKASSNKVTGSSKPKASSNKVTGSSKPKASNSKATSNSKSTVSSNKATSSSKTTVTSCYKVENKKKAASSTYKVPASYSSYKMETSNNKGNSKVVTGLQQEKMATKTRTTNVRNNLKSVINTSKIEIVATVAAVKKKVENTLSKATRELYNSKDYIARLSKAYGAGLDSAGNLVCNEIKDTVQDAKKAVNKKGGIGKDAVNLILEGCEQLTTKVIKGSLELGKLTVKAAMGLAEKTVGAIGKAIDYINPGEDLLSPKEVIKKVESGKVKLNNNLQKGNYGEMKMDQYYESKGYVRISIDRVMDINDPAHQGIDGIYYNIDKQKGEPEFIIGEAKYNQSKLGYTKYDGKQMSDSWILGGNRIENAVGKTFADEVKIAFAMGECQKQVVHVFSNGTYKMKHIKDKEKNKI